jgi:hypothetical protein
MMATAAVLLLVGFAGGYGVRDLVSRRRRAAVRRRYLEEQAQYNSIMYRLDHSRSPSKAS